VKLWQTDSSLDAAVEAYTVGDDPALDARLLPYEVLGSLAHAAGLAKLGLLSKDEHAALRGALGELWSSKDSFKIRRDQEDIHTAVEHFLTTQVGEAGKRIHTGRSRNDQVQTDLRLYVKDALLEIHRLSVAAALAWAGFGRKHGKVLMPGYTHLQRAMPTTVGHWAASHVEALLEGARGLEHAFEEADACPLGSAAGFGVPLALDREYTAKLLGFSRVQRNTLRVQSARPRVEGAAVSALALLARDIGVLAWDLSLFTTSEFGFMKLADAFTTGSSLMPQKRNPDVVELTRARAALFPGWVSQILALGQLPSGYHRDYQLTKGPLVAALECARQLADMAGRIPAALTVDEDACRRALTSETLAVHRALERVAAGTSFRDAYREEAAHSRGKAAAVEGDVRLPDYAGAPGDPAWDALAQDLGARTEWVTAARQALSASWDALLRG